MNWETFKTLTREQKEEYSFKYKDRQLIFNLNGLIYTGVMFIGTISLFLFSLYINLKENILTPEQFKTIFHGVMSISSFLCWVILFYLCFSLIELITILITEYRWKKKNNIKSINKFLIFFKRK